MTKISHDQQIGRIHMQRMWPERHDEHVHVWADGTVHDKAARRDAIRANIRGQRSAKQYAQKHPQAVRWVEA